MFKAYENTARSNARNTLMACVYCCISALRPTERSLACIFSPQFDPITLSFPMISSTLYGFTARTLRLTSEGGWSIFIKIHKTHFSNEFLYMLYSVFGLGLYDVVKSNAEMFDGMNEYIDTRNWSKHLRTVRRSVGVRCRLGRLSSELPVL